MSTNDTAADVSWLLALESSSPHGGASLLRNGTVVETVRLEEGLRHGRELLPAAASLLDRQSLAASDVSCVAVSSGPGSYTGLRVGVMAAKALAFAAGCRLTAVSSLAALAFSRFLDGTADNGATVMVMQDARRDETYVGVYRLEDGEALAETADAAMAPEEAAGILADLREKSGRNPVLAGSGFSTYSALFDAASAFSGAVDPAAVGVLGWRQFLREDFADPLLLQPVYLRRDAGSDWRHDHLISQS